jgi:hypothetical protein
MSGTTARTGERPVSMAALLAAARSATAVSTPPTADSADRPTGPAAADTRPDGASAAPTAEDRPPHTAAAA